MSYNDGWIFSSGTAGSKISLRRKPMTLGKSCFCLRSSQRLLPLDRCSCWRLSRGCAVGGSIIHG
jgi:hypothetical protein